MTLKQNPVVARYTVQNSVPEKTDTIRDLGVWFDIKLKFSEHTNNTINGALGLMFRTIQVPKHLLKFKLSQTQFPYFRGNSNRTKNHDFVIGV